MGVPSGEMHSSITRRLIGTLRALRGRNLLTTATPYARALKRALLLPLLLLLAGAGTAAPTHAAEPLPDALLPANRIVAYYGNPLAPSLGRLGEPPPDQMIARLRQTAAAYADADPARPVDPALELITPLAQASPGADGLYRARMSSDLLDEVATWASDNDLLLILDVQLGRSSVSDELAPLLPYLRRPNTHLALDPEFAMGPTQVPGQAIGSLDATDVNTAMQTLADVVDSEHLPPKVLIVHQFLPSMLTDRDAIQADPRVQVVVDMDGFGSPPVKTSKYDAFVGDAGAPFGGIKLFDNYRFAAAGAGFRAEPDTRARRRHLSVDAPDRTRQARKPCGDLGRAAILAHSLACRKVCPLFCRGRPAAPQRTCPCCAFSISKSRSAATTC